MIDLHTHILPGLDDGPGAMENSLELARQAAAGGTVALAATPHVIAGVYDNSKEKILKAVAQLQGELNKENIKIKVCPGAEYMLDPQLPRQLKEGLLLTLNNAGRHLLVELPAVDMPPWATAVFYDLVLSGVTPVLAHPERNQALLEDPGAIEPLVNMGVIGQITAASLTGDLGRRVQRLACRFIQGGFGCLLASDAHGPKGLRGPDLSRAYAAACRQWGKEAAELLTVKNPSRILGGEGVPATRLEEEAARGGFLTRLFKKRK